MNPATLREVSNLPGNIGEVKQRLAQRVGVNWESYRYAPSSAFSRTSYYNTNASITEKEKEGSTSPQVDQFHAENPVFCSDMIKDITSMYMEKEKQTQGQISNGQIIPSPRYLTYQPEINEKMRMILVDWLIDVHLKFKLHSETIYLAVNIIDRYLSCVNTKRPAGTYVARSQLQLVGITSVLIAAKYEEVWPPEVKECVHISANTYTREEVIRMERTICTALAFRFTVPTPFPYIVRLLSVMEGMEHPGMTAEEYAAYVSLLQHAAFFFLEHVLLDYKCLQFTPSQQANASLFLALVTLRLRREGAAPLSSADSVWTRPLQHYSKTQVAEFRTCAETILDCVSYVPTTKYQAVRRKYSSSKYGEVAKFIMPNEVPEF